jgi:hypothetical protein
VSARPALDLVLARLDPELASHLVPARRLEERRGCRPSGVDSLDELLGGGWPRAALAELSGRRSTGRTAIVLASLGRAIAAGETVALVDVGGTLDPRRAAASGIPLPRLFWIRTDGVGQALRAADLVVAAGGFDLVALDLGDVQPRPPTAAWIRLKHGAERQGTTIVVATPARAVGTFAATAVELSAAAPVFSTPTLLQGLRATATRGRGSSNQAHANDGEARCACVAFTCRS